MPERASGAPFRWAILGTGAVARKFAFGLRACTPPARLHAVVSRDPDRGAAFAQAVGDGRPVAVAATPAEAAEAGAEALYIASPVTLHRAHASAALAVGLPVLVEKPLAENAAEARALAAEARAAGLFAAEALWTRYLPVADAIRARLAEGALGEPVAFSGTFGTAVRRPEPKNASPEAGGLFDGSAGGGALLHRGIYPLSLALMALGPVSTTRAAGRIGPAGADEEAHLLLTHTSGAISQIRASLVADAANDAAISGVGGTLHLAAPIWRPSGLVFRPVRAQPPMAAPRRLERWREGAAGQRLSEHVLAPARRLWRRPERIGAPFRGNGYTHEAEALMRSVAEGRGEALEMPLDESVAALEIIDAARAEIRGRRE